MNSTMITTTGEPTEATTADTSRVPPMVFVDDEGLEENFLTEDEMSQEVMDITANRVTTPVEDGCSPIKPDLHTKATKRRRVEPATIQRTQGREPWKRTR